MYFFKTLIACLLISPYLSFADTSSNERLNDIGEEISVILNKQIVAGNLKQNLSENDIKNLDKLLSEVELYIDNFSSEELDLIFDQITKEYLDNKKIYNSTSKKKEKSNDKTIKKKEKPKDKTIKKEEKSKDKNNKNTK